MLNWDDLRIVMSLANENTLSGAAVKLKMTPSTVSRRLRKVQHELGVCIAKLSPNGHSLTDDGRKIAEIAQNMAVSVREIEEVKVNASSTKRLISIGCSQLLADTVLAESVQELRAAYPNLELSLVSDASDSDVVHHRVDVNITLAPPELSSLTVRKICEIHFCLVSGLETTEATLFPCADTAVNRDDTLFVILEKSGLDAQAAWLQALVTDETRVIRTDSYHAQLALMENHNAIGLGPKSLMNRSSGFTEVCEFGYPPPGAVYLSFVKETLDEPHLRSVVKTLAAKLRALIRRPTRDAASAVGVAV
jgi:DNA-binding transcriptional LysR family regulator